MFSLKTVRLVVQVCFALLFILVPWLNAREIHHVTGNLLSFTFFGVPLADPLAVVQAFISSGEVATRALTGAAIALLLAMLLGAVFCSWICPFGLLSELMQRVQVRFGRAHPLNGPDGFRGKLWAVGIFLVLLLLFGLPPVLNQLSMPGWYSRVWQMLQVQHVVPVGGALLLTALGVDAILGRRFWCRYCCPQSLLLMVVQKLSPWRWRVRFTAAKCTCSRMRPCGEACSLGLNPRGSKEQLESECSNCGDCVVACSRYGKALEQRFTRK